MKKKTVLEPHKGLVYGYLVPLLTIALLILLVGLSFFSLYVNTKVERGDLIAQEVLELADIIQRIDQACTIEAFLGDKVTIDFLTIKKGGFIGSEVGSLVLGHPEHWQGPYRPRSLEFEGIPYEILHTQLGHFVVPGDGVKLPNGSIVGKDIVLNKQSDIKALTMPHQPLNFRGKALAISLHLKHYKGITLPNEPQRTVKPPIQIVEQED